MIHFCKSDPSNAGGFEFANEVYQNNLTSLGKAEVLFRSFRLLLKSSLELNDTAGSHWNSHVSFPFAHTAPMLIAPLGDMSKEWDL